MVWNVNLNEIHCIDLLRDQELLILPPWAKNLVFFVAINVERIFSNQLLWLRWISCSLPRQCALSLGTDSLWLPESVIWWLLINCYHHHQHVLVLSPFWMTMINGVLCCRCYPHSCPLLKITPSRGSSAIYALTKIAKGHSFQNARTRWCYFFKSTMLFIWLCTRNPLFSQNYLM